MPEQWIDDVVGDETRPRTGFEDQLARDLHREWRGGRNPWRALAWTAAALALVVGTVAVLTRDDDGRVVPADSTVPQTVDSTAPASTSPAVVGSPYVAIGDSVMLGAKDLLEADNIVVDASENRGALSTKDAIDAAVQVGRIGRGSAVLVQVGTNGPLDQAALDDLLQAVPSYVDDIRLMTLRAPAPWIAANNALIRGAPDRDPRVRVVDWEALSTVSEVELCPDGIHISCNESARSVYAEIVRQALGAPVGTTTTTGPATTVDPSTSIGVTRYLTALAEGDYDTAARLLNEGGLELEARADLRPLFRPEFGLVPGKTDRAALAAALEKWCARALCVQPTDVVDLPDGRWTKAVFPMGPDGTTESLFTDYVFEGQQGVTGLPLQLPPNVADADYQYVSIDCPIDQVSRVDWADVDGDGWIEQLVSQIVAEEGGESGVATYRVTTCGTSTEVEPFEITGDGLVVYPVNPTGEGADTLLIGFAEGYPIGTIFEVQGGRIVEIPGTSWGFGPPVTGAEQRTIGCADLRGDGTVELVNYTFTDTDGQLVYAATSALGSGASADGRIAYVSPQADAIRIGVCNGLPVMTN